MVKVTIVVLLSGFLMIFYLKVQLFLSLDERNKNYFKTPKGQEALMFLSYPPKHLQVSICYLPDVQSKLCLPAV